MREYQNRYYALNKTENQFNSLARIRKVAGFGYSIDDSISYPLLSKWNGIVDIATPAFWLGAEHSVNRNLLTTTETLSTQTTSLSVGSFTFWFGSGAGSLTSSNNSGTATGHGTATFGRDNAITIVVTSAGTFDFSVSGSAQQAMLSAGTSASNYQPRTNATATKALDLVGSNDGTFVNGTSADMFDGESFVFDATSTQYLQTTYEIPTGDQTWFLKFNYADTSEVMLISADTAGSLQSYLGSSGAINVDKAGSGTIASSTGTITAGADNVVSYSYNATSGECKIYINGVLSGTNTNLVTLDAGTDMRLGAYSSGVYAVTGNIYSTLAFDSVLSPSQIAQISNLI